MWSYWFHAPAWSYQANLRIGFGYFAAFRELSLTDISHLVFADVSKTYIRNVISALIISLCVLRSFSFISKPYILSAGSDTNTFSVIQLISIGTEGAHMYGTRRRRRRRCNIYASVCMKCQYKTEELTTLKECSRTILENLKFEEIVNKFAVFLWISRLDIVLTRSCYWIAFWDNPVRISRSPTC